MAGDCPERRRGLDDLGSKQGRTEKRQIYPMKYFVLQNSVFRIPPGWQIPNSNKNQIHKRRANDKKPEFPPSGSSPDGRAPRRRFSGRPGNHAFTEMHAAGFSLNPFHENEERRPYGNSGLF